MKYVLRPLALFVAWLFLVVFQNFILAIHFIGSLLWNFSFRQAWKDAGFLWDSPRVTWRELFRTKQGVSK